MLAKIDEQISREGDLSVFPELIGLYTVIVERKRNPYLAYRLGQLLLNADRAEEAQVYFYQAHERSNEEDFYHKAAGIMALKLSLGAE
jgi:hypothetical protein